MAEPGQAYSENEGTFLVALARSAVEQIVEENRKVIPPGDTPETLLENSGVFVTLNKLNPGGMARRGHRHELRGCIGRPMPSLPLIEAVIDSAVDAATRDPRFSPVTPAELGEILVEVTALTPPVLLVTDKPQDREQAIRVGRDGLLIEATTRYGKRRGLLLPQVPVEWGWDEKEFLAQICWKAGLTPDFWLDPATKLYTFRGEIFAEESPRGKVIRKIITHKNDS